MVTKEKEKMKSISTQSNSFRLSAFKDRWESDNFISIFHSNFNQERFV